MGTLYKCADCGYCQGYAGANATRKGFQCEHPDQKYIFNYFRENKIRKMEGFIGFGEKFSNKPTIKSSPAWCPKKRLKEEESDDNSISK